MFFKITKNLYKIEIYYKVCARVKKRDTETTNCLNLLKEISYHCIFHSLFFKAKLTIKLP